MKPASRYLFAERLDRIEELLASGLPSGAVEQKQSVEWGISRRQVRNYIRRVYARRETERVADAPYRRENLLRKIERFYAKSMAREKFGPAAQILVLEARLSGAFDSSSDREALIKRLGPPPEDPGEMLVYTRRVLMASLYEAMASPQLDVEKRQRIISDLAFKIAATHSRTQVEEEVLRIEAAIGARRALPPAAEVVDAKSAGWGEAATGRGSNRGPRALPGSGLAPREGEDRGDPAPSGGALGST